MRLYGAFCCSTVSHRNEKIEILGVCAVQIKNFSEGTQDTQPGKDQGPQQQVDTAAAVQKITEKLPQPVPHALAKLEKPEDEQYTVRSGSGLFQTVHYVCGVCTLECVCFCTIQRSGLCACVHASIEVYVCVCVRVDCGCMYVCQP